jgi:hypothetical protein
MSVLVPTPLQESMNTLATVVRRLADRWKFEGCKAFDEGCTPAEVAEAAGRLRCALELAQLLDTLENHPPDRAPRLMRANGSGGLRETPSH